jgi:hypothetical protein
MTPRTRVMAALTFISVTGAGVRFVHYLDRRSLWLDEAMLALNVAARGFRGLLRPLDYHQAAPVGFLWLERLAVLAAGPGELAFRAAPLLAGLAVVPLAGLVARRLFGDAAGLVAALLCAASPVLVRYSNEAKPYSTDAFATLGLVGAALLVADDVESRRRWWLLALVGLFAVLVSFPALFTAAAVVAALIVHPRARLHWARALVLGAAWVVPVALAYVFVHRAIAGHAAQQEGYERAFLVPGAIGERLGLALSGTLIPVLWGDGSGIPRVPAIVPWAIAASIAGGTLLVARRAGAWTAVLLLGPFVVSVAASALRRYPLGVPRMMTFTAALFLVAVAALVAAALQPLARLARPPFVAAVVLLLVSPMALQRVRETRNPWKGEDAATLVAAFRDRPRPQEPVYVGAKGLPSWVFYTTNWEEPHAGRLAFYARAADGPSYDNAPPRPRPVVDEGRDLVFRYRGRREILGLSPGSQWSWPTYVKRTADEGWAKNEAARIAREANPCAWLYFTHVSDGTQRPIFWHLRDDHRGKVDFDLWVAGGMITRVCFPYTKEQIEDLARWERETGQVDAPRE